MRYLAKYVRRARVERKWSCQRLAKEIGYKNLNRGARRIIHLEREGGISKELLNKISESLELNPEKVQELQRKDEEDLRRRREAWVKKWEAWVKEPVPMELIVRIIPAVYLKREIPEDIADRETAIEFAKKIAKTEVRKVCLVISRRESAWINEEGKAVIIKSTPHKLNMPWIQIK